MPNYDPSMEALVAEMLGILAPDVETDALGYIDQLRAVQTALGGPPHGQDGRGAGAGAAGGRPGAYPRGRGAAAHGPGQARRQGRGCGTGKARRSFGAC